MLFGGIVLGAVHETDSHIEYRNVSARHLHGWPRYHGTRSTAATVSTARDGRVVGATTFPSSEVAAASTAAPMVTGRSIPAPTASRCGCPEDQISIFTVGAALACRHCGSSAARTQDILTGGKFRSAHSAAQGVGCAHIKSPGPSLTRTSCAAATVRRSDRTCEK